MKSKANFFDTLVYDKPPFYEHEVQANLEEISLNTKEAAKESKNNIIQVMDSVQAGNQDIINAINDNSERELLANQIRTEITAQGFSQLNYDISSLKFSISDDIRDLSFDVRSGTEQITKQLRESSAEIVAEIKSGSEDICSAITKLGANISTDLVTINHNINLTNRLLSAITDELAQIRHLIAKGKETQAIELIDQIKVCMALERDEDALQLSREAMELCSGTSITVSASHIIVLSIYGRQYLNEIVKTYQDLVKTIEFRLKSAKGEDLNRFKDEVFYIFYPLHNALSLNLNKSILDHAHVLYGILIEEQAHTPILKDPLRDQEAQKMSLTATPLRELCWSMVFKYYIKPNSTQLIRFHSEYNDIEYYKNDVTKFLNQELIVFIKIVFQSNIQVKNELLYMCMELLLEQGWLHEILLAYIRLNPTADEHQQQINRDISLLIRLVLLFEPKQIKQLSKQDKFILSKFILTEQVPIGPELNKQIKTFYEQDYLKTIKNYLTAYKNGKNQALAIEQQLLIDLEKWNRSLLTGIQRQVGGFEGIKQNDDLDEKNLQQYSANLRQAHKNKLDNWKNKQKQIEQEKSHIDGKIKDQENKKKYKAESMDRIKTFLGDEVSKYASNAGITVGIIFFMYIFVEILDEVGDYGVWKIIAIPVYSIAAGLLSALAGIAAIIIVYIVFTILNMLTRARIAMGFGGVSNKRYDSSRSLKDSIEKNRQTQKNYFNSLRTALSKADSKQDSSCGKAADELEEIRVTLRAEYAKIKDKYYTNTKLTDEQSDNYMAIDLGAEDLIAGSFPKTIAFNTDCKSKIKFQKQVIYKLNIIIDEK